jgi:hypothetical protein
MRLSLLGLSVLLCAAPAFAQAPGDEPAPPPPPPGPPAEPAPPPAPPPVIAPVVAPAPPPEAITTADPGTLEDANSGRVAIMPTALTPPKGTFSFEDEELFFIGASYAVTDNLVISGTTMVPITDSLYWGFLSAKLQVVKQGRLRVAVQAGAAGASTKDTTTTFDMMGNEMQTSVTTSGGGFDLGAVATYCFDDGCFSHGNVAVAAGFAEQDNSSVPVGFMGGLVLKVASKVRLIAEADTAHLFGKISDQANGFLGWYGVRFTSRNIGVDLALVKPFCGNGECDTTTFPAGFPFVTFSYRAL